MHTRRPLGRPEGVPWAVAWARAYRVVPRSCALFTSSAQLTCWSTPLGSAMTVRVRWRLACGVARAMLRETTEIGSCGPGAARDGVEPTVRSGGDSRRVTRAD